MIVLVWIFFCISALLDLLENYWVVHRYPIERPAFFTPQNQSIIFITRIILFIVSIIGIWYFYNFIIALIAFIIYMVLGLSSSKFFYNKKLTELKSYYYQIHREAFKNEKITEKEIIILSEEKANERIKKNMKGLN